MQMKAEVTTEQLRVLQDLYPYLKMVNSPKAKILKTTNGVDYNKGDFGHPVEIKTTYGWLMHYHPPKGKNPASLTVSAPRVDDVLSEITIQQKTIRTAVEVVEFLKTQGWEKFEVDSGSPKFQMAAWAYLKHENLPVKLKEAGQNFENNKESNAPIFETYKQDLLQNMTKEPVSEINDDLIKGGK